MNERLLELFLSFRLSDYLFTVARYSAMRAGMVEVIYRADKVKKEDEKED